MLIMADIGHAREHADRLTWPFPMTKCAFEGAFSLYEGLYEYVQHQGARPNSVMVLGDVAYGGGDRASNNDTRVAFQKYLGGHVPDDRVYVAIGNHDVHYLGCTTIEVGGCHYGSATEYGLESAYSTTYTEWRAGWVDAFPGLRDAVIPRRSGEPWQAPLRYNLNIDINSSVHIIVGLISGAGQTSWNNDTPAESVDGLSNGTMECEFLEASLEHGRSLGKTIFVYMTHHFGKPCEDWELLRQIDVWLMGHKHNIWQSAANGETVIKEQRHYPARMLLGNGGFDEAHTDVVSFAHVTEELVSGGERVRLRFDVFDTCVSDQECPDGPLMLTSSCWRHCKAFPGGFDGGGGPRKAVPSTHGYGFFFEAPRKPLLRSAWAGEWRIRSGGDTPAWIGAVTCPWFGGLPNGALCFIHVSTVEAASSFSLYDVVADAATGNLSCRVAVNDATRAPLLSAAAGGGNETVAANWLYRPSVGFWDTEGDGSGTLRPSDAHRLQLQPAFGAKSGAGAWQLRGMAFRTLGVVRRVDALVADAGSSLAFLLERTPNGTVPEELPITLV